MTALVGARRVLFVVLPIAALLLVGCGPALQAGEGGLVDAAAPGSTLAPLTGPSRNVPTPPDGQSYFGIQMDWGSDSPLRYTARLGRSPAVYGRFIGYPLDAGSKSDLSAEVSLIAQQHAMFFVTLEPNGGPSTVTESNAEDLARTVASWNQRGVDTFVRFGQEMNGSWYAWGQRPTAYIRAFRIIADAIHRIALKSVMVWSPNFGGGYPFLGEGFNAKPTDPDFPLLDTNHDGQLTHADDPYAPYYPGDAYVDWIGITLYHWGCTFPWGPNVIPEPNKFVDELTGVYHSACQDERYVGNFYQEFPVAHHKPMAISETSAFFDEGNVASGAPNADIKTAWMAQVFDPSFTQRFPLIKMENWFEFRHKESGEAGILDWRGTDEPAVLDALKAALGPRFILAPIRQ